MGARLLQTIQTETMDPEYLARLKEQRSAIDAFLQAHRESPAAHPSLGVQMTLKIYTDILEDALKTVNSLIQHLEPPATKR